MRSIIVLFILVLTACTTQRSTTTTDAAPVTTSPTAISTTLPATATPLPGTPLTMNSLNTEFAMAGILEGVYLITNDTITITATKIHIYNRDTAPYKGRSLIQNITLALGVPLKNGHWKTINESATFTVQQTTIPGDEVILTDVTFTIDRQQISDLTNNWLVLTINNDILDYPGRELVRATAYIHSERDIFSTYMQRQVD